MRLIIALAATVALASSTQRAQEQAFISFGTAKVALGMTVQQVVERLSGAGRHLRSLSDKETALVYLNGADARMEGQVTFSSGRAIYAAFQMPNVTSADELAQEIAGAVDSMDTKTCTISNYSAHGTGGGFSQSVFECGGKRFNVMTVRTLGSKAQTINVNLEIGQTIAK